MIHIILENGAMNIILIAKYCRLIFDKKRLSGDDSFKNMIHESPLHTKPYNSYRLLKKPQMGSRLDIWDSS